MNYTYLPAAQVIPGDVIVTEGKRLETVKSVEPDTESPGYILIDVGWEKLIMLAHNAAVAVSELAPR